MTPMISRILVATDFGAASDSALDYAMTLAGRFGATVHLVHVIDESIVTSSFAPQSHAGAIPAFRERVIDAAASQLARQIPVDRQGLSVTSEVRLGSVADTIREIAGIEHCDLIVMGTHGRTGMAQLPLGSVAEEVVRQSPCPVLTVRATPPWWRWREFFGHHYVRSEQLRGE